MKIVTLREEWDDQVRDWVSMTDGFVCLFIVSYELEFVSKKKDVSGCDRHVLY